MCSETCSDIVSLASNLRILQKWTKEAGGESRKLDISYVQAIAEVFHNTLFEKRDSTGNYSRKRKIHYLCRCLSVREFYRIYSVMLQSMYSPGKGGDAFEVGEKKVCFYNSSGNS